MNERHEDSAELAAMMRDMSAIKDASRLASWADDPKTQRQYSALAPAEQSTMRARKAAKVAELLSDETPPEKKTTKAKAGE